MAKKSAMQTVQENIRKVNPHYDLDFAEINDLCRGSTSAFMLVVHSFTYGYVKGQRAERARRAKC